MTPRQFLKKYTYDDRLVTGEYFSSEPLVSQEGDRVGVVLMNLGGPDRGDDVAPFLYNLFMDPAIIDIPVGGILRHWLCRLIASRRSQHVRKDDEVIGGGSPLNRLTREQAAALEKYLMREFGEESGGRARRRRRSRSIPRANPAKRRALSSRRTPPCGTGIPLAKKLPS